MSPEERIAQLERDLADERAERRRLASIVEQMVLAQIAREQSEQSAKATRRARNLRHRSGDVSDAVSRASHETSHSPPPSLPPPSPSPSLSAPISPPPISSPNPSSPPSFSLVASEMLSGKPVKKAKEANKREPTGDPRHAQLVKALTDAGWPFDGGKDAAQVKALLALADQQEATRGEFAGLEVLRRAQIAWSQFPGFHSARTLTGLRSKWGEFVAPDTGRGQGPPDFRRGSVRAELIDHTQPEEPF